MQERASALRRLADEEPGRRAGLLDVAQRLEGLAHHAALAAFGRTARLSNPPGNASASGADGFGIPTGANDSNSGLFGTAGRKADGIDIDT